LAKIKRLLITGNLFFYSTILYETRNLLLDFFVLTQLKNHHKLLYHGKEYFYMEKDYYSTDSLLTRRIEQNYEDFKEAIFKLDKATIFEYAPTIAAVKETYMYMKTSIMNDKEAAYFLSLDNPLKMLADAWEEHSHSKYRSDEFVGVYVKTIDSLIDSYKDNPIADELRKKYGSDVPINTAALLEIVELGKKIFDFYDFDFEFDDDGEDDY